MNNDINEYICGQGTGTDINTDQMVGAKRSQTFIIRATNRSEHERPSLIAYCKNANIRKAHTKEEDNTLFNIIS